MKNILTVVSTTLFLTAMTLGAFVSQYPQQTGCEDDITKINPSGLHSLVLFNLDETERPAPSVTSHAAHSVKGVTRNEVEKKAVSKKQPGKGSDEELKLKVGCVLQHVAAT